MVVDTNGKEAVVAYFKTTSEYCLDNWKKVPVTSRRIRTVDVPSASQ